MINEECAIIIITYLYDSDLEIDGYLRKTIVLVNFADFAQS